MSLPHGEIPEQYERWNKNTNKTPGLGAMYWSDNGRWEEWENPDKGPAPTEPRVWIIASRQFNPKGGFKLGDIVTWGSCSSNGTVIEVQPEGLRIKMGNNYRTFVAFGPHHAGSPLKLIERPLEG